MSMVSETLRSFFIFLERIGLVDVLLPFILVFAIVFGILEKTLVLGKDKRNANLIVAMMMAFMVVAVINYTNIINDIARIFGLLIIMVVAFALIYGLFGRNLQIIKKKEGSSGGRKPSSDRSGSGKSGKWKDLGNFDSSKPPFNE
jgi:hypothetical protein